MRSGSATAHARLDRLFGRNIAMSRRAGIIDLKASSIGAGDVIEVDGRRALNFGNCSYLGLNTDRRLVEAAIEAVERFTPFYASSARYVAPDLYEELSEGLGAITGAHVLVPTTTTLAHLGALPVLVGSDDVVLVDNQAHATIQLALEVVSSRQVPVVPVPHNDMDELAGLIAEHSGADRVWYVADGIYSMYGDLAPYEALAGLLEKHANLHLYIDDAHGFAWQGLHGRGTALEALGVDPRVVVAAGLAKGFGSGGAVLAFGDPEMAERVGMIGVPFTFSGPIPSANLGAAVASTRILLSDEHRQLQRRLLDQIALTRRLAEEAALEVIEPADTPVWFVRVGDTAATFEVVKRLMDAGFYTNTAAFPAVPMGMGGVRFTNSLSVSETQVGALIEAMARIIAEVRSETRLEIDLRDGAAAAD